MSDRERGPEYAEYRLGDETHEVPDPTWAVMPADDPEENIVWIDLIGHDTGEWSSKFTPEQARRVATALHAAADKKGHVPDDDAPQPAEL